MDDSTLFFFDGWQDGSRAFGSTDGFVDSVVLALAKQLVHVLLLAMVTFEFVEVECPNLMPSLVLHVVRVGWWSSVIGRVSTNDCKEVQDDFQIDKASIRNPIVLFPAVLFSQELIEVVDIVGLFEVWPHMSHVAHCHQLKDSRSKFGHL